MRYLALLKAARPTIPAPPELMAAIMKLGEEATNSGNLLDTAGLAPSAMGARVNLSAGDLTVTDGPFAEAKEVLGGYWMIQVKSKEEAVEWASRCPASDNEVIEVRQVQELSDFPADVKEAASGFTEMQARSGQRQGA
jgi:hypothetical protein